jgi:hypothetical protein
MIEAVVFCSKTTGTPYYTEAVSVRVKAQISFSGTDTCTGYPCFFFAAMDSEAAPVLYSPETSAMQKRCKITRCVYEKRDYRHLKQGLDS